MKRTIDTFSSMDEVFEAFDGRINKFADPIEDAREGLTADEAREVAAEDPSLLWVEVYNDSDNVTVACLRAECDSDGWSVHDMLDGISVWVPGDEAADEIVSSDDPAAAAIRICSEAPTRGDWHN